MKIIHEETRTTRKGPEAWFQGDVWLDEVVTTTAPPTFKVVRVTFAPGARTAWHTHPRGQALHIVSGMGRVQLKGGPVLEIRSGDTIWIEAGELHWHGAAPDHTLVHLAMQQANEQGIDVVWLEHVTDAEYSLKETNTGR